MDIGGISLLRVQKYHVDRKDPIRPGESSYVQHTVPIKLTHLDLLYVPYGALVVKKVRMYLEVILDLKTTPESQ